MKLSLRFREETRHQNPLLRAKIPVTILGFPFLTGIVAGDASDLSFSLRSNFSSGPSLSLSYHPTLSPPSICPFSISLKSGIGLFGSPHNSPLTFAANFNPSSLTPTFSLLIKPQFGNFSLFKSVSSSNSGSIKPDAVPQNGELSSGSVSEFDIRDGLGYGSIERVKGLTWSNLKRDASILSGILVAARTSIPLTKKAVVNFRWGVSFPPESGVSKEPKAQFPVLVMNKVSLEKVGEVKKEESKKNKADEVKAGDVELLKGMCSWMRREVEDLQKENWEMKQTLEGMRLKVPVASKVRCEEREREVAGKRVMPLPTNGDGSSEFDKWRSKKGGGNGNGNAEESKKSQSRMSEVENELQKAIKAASS
ncbi:Prolyl endopeptidase-like [Bienertia sinuspersici]